MSELYDYASANQVVQAGLTNSSITQNSFLTSAQMDQMQKAYKHAIEKRYHFFSYGDACLIEKQKV